MHFFYRIYPVVIVALLAAGSIWLEHMTRAPESAATADNDRAPDFVADQVRILGFAEDGKLRYQLDSPRMVHLPATDSTSVDQPRLLFVSQARHLRVNADHGEVGPKGERVDLDGNVETERESNPGEAPLRLLSEKLTVWPQEQRAVSTVPVRITQGDTSADAKNFSADNIFGLMKLSGNVRMSLPPRTRRNP